MKEREVDKRFKEQALCCDKICTKLEELGYGCKDCKENCCFGQVIGLLRSEVIDIANHLNISKEEFRRKYTEITTHPSSNTRVRCLKPSVDNISGKECCRFLVDGKCSIYPVRPSTCRGHPFYYHKKKKLVTIHGTIDCTLVLRFNRILRDFLRQRNIDNVSILVNEAPAIRVDIVKEMLDLS